mgnify:CR=1 FL=1
MTSRWPRRVLGIYVFVLALFLLAPIVMVIPMSFNNGGTLAFPPTGFSLRWYQDLAVSVPYREALLTSVIVTACATALSLTLALLSAYALTRFEFAGRSMLASLLVSPLIFPHIVLGLALVVFLSSVGLLRTYPGLIIGTTIVALPYAVRSLLPALMAVTRSVDEAALTLGASRLQVIWRVILPNIRPGFISALMLCAIVVFDEFTVSLFVSGSDTVTLPVRIYHDSYYGVSPLIAAVGVVLIAVSVVAVLVLERTVGFERAMGLGAAEPPVRPEQ